MSYPSLKFLKKLDVTALPTEELAYYAYALTSCQYPASVVCGEWYQMIDDICSRKIAELREEIKHRLESGDDSKILTHALAVLDGTADLVKDNRKWAYPTYPTQLSETELIELYSMSRCWYDLRRKKDMEVFTRSYQWRIVNELRTRICAGILAQILQLAEFIEVDGYAHNIRLPYIIGEKIKSFMPSNYSSDEDLKCHINSLASKADYVSREELIQIADYIQTEIVEKGDIAKHMALVNSILCADIPSFEYPEIVRAFEKATRSLAKSDEKKEIELAPFFYSLWGLTQKQTYLAKFEKTVRQCYLALASDKHYPNLGIDKEDPKSLASAIRFLDEYRLNVWIINDKYNVDKVISKYKTA